jgi:hypothetical protein
MEFEIDGLKKKIKDGDWLTFCGVLTGGCELKWIEAPVTIGRDEAGNPGIIFDYPVGGEQVIFDGDDIYTTHFGEVFLENVKITKRNKN